MSKKLIGVNRGLYFYGQKSVKVKSELWDLNQAGRINQPERLMSKNGCSASKLLLLQETNWRTSGAIWNFYDKYPMMDYRHV
jgi:hypothetical protein